MSTGHHRQPGELGTKIGLMLECDCREGHPQEDAFDEAFMRGGPPVD